MIPRLVLFSISSLCFLPWDSGQLADPAYALGTLLSCNSSEDCVDINFSSCEEGYCECNPGYHYDIRGDDHITCVKCPGIRESCPTNCCYPPILTECRQNVCRCSTNVTSSKVEIDCSGAMDAFKLATQIALGSALILATACLLAILYKSCKRRREIARRMAGDSTVRPARRRRLRGARRSSSQTSLSSGQLRVVELLRDRPPDYYDRTHIRIEKPPTYEETLGQPQRFPIITIDACISMNQELPPVDERRISVDEIPADHCPPTYEMASMGVGNAAFLMETTKTGESDAPVSSDAVAELHM